METVLDALKAMKKATYREVAARLDIEPVEALNMLREQKDQGLCDFADGGWFIGTAKEQQVKRIRPKQESPLVARVLSVMQGQGKMSSNLIAEKLGKSSRALNASLGAMIKDGLLVRHVDGKNITWSLPGEPEKSPALATTIKTTAEIIQNVPACIIRQDDLLIPSSSFIAREIRRTKAKLSNLQRLQGAVRELRRHKHLLDGLNDE